MPILAREPDLYPSDLLDDDSFRVSIPASSDAQWWGLYTISRREKDLMRRLRALGIPHYCPLAPHRYRSPAGRVRTTWAPLFSGYVFLFGTPDDRYAALTTNCVSRTILVNDGEKLRNELRDVRDLILLDRPVTLEAKLEVGCRVRFRSGPFRGREAKIIQRRGKTRLLVMIEFLQQGVSVEAEDFEFEAVS